MATRRAIMKRPPLSWHRSWPATAANSSAASLSAPSSFAALERGEHRGRVRAETVHQLLSSPGIVPVAVRLGA